MSKLSIGGYFELEISLPIIKTKHPYDDSIILNSARNCLEYILRVKKYTKIYIPYFTCDVLLEPLQKLNIEYEFYDIDFNLEPLFDYSIIKDTEAFLFTNYFGIKNSFVSFLSRNISDKLIIDNAQSLFSEPVPGIDTFYSPRKFIGIPDGGYLFTNTTFDNDFEQDESYERMSHLLKRIDLSAEEGYSDFCDNDKSLSNQPIKKMSNLTERILRGVDFNYIKQKRRENFIFLHENLKDKNLLNIDFDDDCVPMIYPLRTKERKIRQKLIAEKIYCASYWPNVLTWCDNSKNAFWLTQEIIALPIDQRYSIEHMKKILEYV